MIAGLLDHIWQSTLFAAGIAALTMLFRRNGAAVRFWLWFAASLKFLAPFAVLALAGQYLSHLFPASLPKSFLAFQPTAAKFSAPVQMLAAGKISPHQNLDLAPLLLGRMAAGCWRHSGGAPVALVPAAGSDSDGSKTTASIPKHAGSGHGFGLAAGTGSGGNCEARRPAATRIDGAPLACGTRFHPGA